MPFDSTWKYIPDSSFLGGISGAATALRQWNIPQPQTSPVIDQTKLKQTFLPPKREPVNPNVNPDVFKGRILKVYPDGVSQDGRKFTDIPSSELVAKFVRKYPDGVTEDWLKYTDFLPRPASPSDSLEYRLKQIESLSTTPKSQFYTPTGTIRGQTGTEKKFTNKVTARQNESELMKTLKAPYRWVETAMDTFSQGTQWAISDVLDLFGMDKTAEKIRSWLKKQRFEQSILQWGETQGLISGIQEWKPSAIIGSLFTAIPNLLLYANPVGATAWIVSTGGGLSLEWEEQWQGGFGDKTIAYSAGTISGLLDKISGQKFFSGLLSKWIPKIMAQDYVTKTKNFLSSLKPSDFEAGTEILQQKIENYGRQLMGTEYDKWWKQYIEAGVLGKALGKVADVGYFQSPTINTPAPESRSTRKNIETLSAIKTGITGNKDLKNAKARGFDPIRDVATYQELAPEIDKDGKVNTDQAQINLQEWIQPHQDTLDTLIDQEGKKVSAQSFRDAILAELKNKNYDIENYPKWIARAEGAIKTAVQEHWDKYGNIPVTAIQNIKKEMYAQSNFRNPDDSYYKALGRAAKVMIENNTDSEQVKLYNNELARWYTTLDYLKTLGSGTKTVKWGKLGKYFARLAGQGIWGLAWSVLWPVGTAVWGIVWGEVWNVIQGKALSGALSKTRANIPQSDIFKRWQQTLQNKKANMLLPPPSGMPISAPTVNVQPITGYSPWILDKLNMTTTRSSQVQSQLPQSNSERTPLLPAKVQKPTIEALLPKRKKESWVKTWKKVNTPIIPKKKINKDVLPKKSETPKTNIPKKDLAPSKKSDTIGSMNIKEEAKKYKSAEEFVKANEKDIQEWAWWLVYENWKTKRDYYTLIRAYSDVLEKWRNSGYYKTALEDGDTKLVQEFDKLKTKSQLEQIYKEAHRSLPMSDRSAVKYSEPVMVDKFSTPKSRAREELAKAPDSMIQRLLESRIATYEEAKALFEKKGSSLSKKQMQSALRDVREIEPNYWK